VNVQQGAKDLQCFFYIYIMGAMIAVDMRNDLEKKNCATFVK
jgi:hypothetical protein